MKIAVVGAGIVGLSAAWSLVRLGHEVTVYEQAPIPNPYSASYDDHRMIRPHYGAQTGYTRMVAEAFEAWDMLWDDLGVDHFAKTGVLAVDLGDHDWMQATQQAFDETNTPYDVLDYADIEVHAPALSIPTQAWGLHTDNAGVLFAGRIVSDMASWLLHHGALLRTNCRVTGLDTEKGRLTLEDGDRVDADRIVVAAGAWVDLLLPALSDRVKPIRSVVSYVQPPVALEASWAGGPALFLMTPSAHLYCLPPVRGSGLKFGGAPILRPGDPRKPVNYTGIDTALIEESFAPYLKDPLGHKLTRGAGAFYADPSDKRFIAEVQGRAIVVTGCGGRMFKFGALMGQRVAECVNGETSADQLASWARGEVDPVMVP